jgi:hypothetical protein
MPLPSGTRLGPYEILAPLGAGGRARCSASPDTRPGCEVAAFSAILIMHKVRECGSRGSEIDDGERSRLRLCHAAAATALKNHLLPPVNRYQGTDKASNYL